jgi:tRNA-specific 2-thiouridylase
MAKIRYRQADQSCTVTETKDGLKVEFDSPQRAAAMRQSIVFYDGENCLGGGMISKIGPSLFIKS